MIEFLSLVIHGCSHISIHPAAVYPAFDGPEGAAQALRWEPAGGRVEGGREW